MLKFIKRHLFLFIIFILLFIFVAIPYGRVEILTLIHGDEFHESYKQTGMIDEVKLLKFYSYSDDKATVYCVDECSGDLLYMDKSEGKWVLDNWKTVWSKQGSADDFIWPYYR